MLKQTTYILLGIFFISLVSAQPMIGGGGGSYTIPCEDWCNNYKPYETFCNENNECQFNVEIRDEYMLSFDGKCSDYFSLMSDEYDECWNWWMDYYHDKNIENLEKANRNLKIAIFIMVIVVILKIIHLMNVWTSKEEGK